MTSLVKAGSALPATVPKSRRAPDWLVRQLPVGMLDSSFFVRFVSIFQQVGSTLLDDADNIENSIDVSVAPDSMVRWLASWIGTDSIDPSLDEEMQRRIVAGAASTLTRRGTVRGLREFLELISGGPVVVQDGGGVWADGEAPRDTAWVRMYVLSTGWLSESDFVDVVQDEIPAHVRAQLWVGDTQVWPRTEQNDVTGEVAVQR